MAAVPITTRATPRSARAAAASALRTPPPACTGTLTAAAMAPIRARLTGSPVRAASRSTVWIHGAPAATNDLSHRHGVVAVDALAIEVALRELHDLAAPKIDRREELHQVATSAEARSTKACRTARPVRLDFSGWNCVAHTSPWATAATTGPP